MLFVGDDWAEDHHDVEVQDDAGRRLTKARVPEGAAGIARLHAMVGQHLPEDADPGQVVVGIETDRGPWVSALVAAGYRVIAVNPLQAARYRERYSTSGAKSDAGDAHALADMVRTDRHQLRQVAGDSDLADAVKLVARAHQSLVWDRTRQVQRLRSALLESFPAALVAFDDLDAPDTLELLAKAPSAAEAARLTVAQISAVLKRARRRKIPERAAAIRAALRAEQLPVGPASTLAYAVVVRAQAGLLTALNAEVARLEEQVEAHFGEHPDAEVLLSQPGLGTVLAARVLAEFGDDPKRYTDAKARRDYAGTSPITRASGRKTVVMARYARNNRLADALHQQAFCALNASPGARAYYDAIRGRGKSHHAALRQLGNRLVGILHGCLKTRTPYDEATAWPRNVTLTPAA
ncbi:Transposase IS116/IS110/IS902 family protein [Parafrankia irregularis]|uniref:Transposase IS116/IS110/IS902 family protein n=1 Tax=Parafrankia irregularis TaxID=795642 RepID=A0A0S4QLQ4_9ACTN|nr:MULTISPECIES: IS110 family transposase [Parafrankia]MBE3205666.1 IS110 family transposase [Parafrankia sp. CH37]CUU55434.1 Transposase IS116/IS110/IS902 family protein [Parafrankia irregularis]